MNSIESRGLPPLLLYGGYAACLLLSLLAQTQRWLQPLDASLYDLQLRTLRALHGTALANDVQIIGLDEGSFRAFPEPFALWHRPFARLFAALGQAPPAAVGLDVVLPDRSYEFIAPGQDRILVAALLAARKQYPLVIAQTLGQDGAARSLFAPYVAAVGRGGVGSAIVCGDPDGVIRQYDGSLCDGSPVPTLPGRMAERLGRTPQQVPGGWHGHIDFRIGAALRYTPMQDVVAAAERGDAQFLERFRGRPVLIGAVLPFDDRVLLPVPLADWERGNRRVPGVLLHAQVLRSMLNYGFLQPLGPVWVAVLTTLLCCAWFLSGPLCTPVYWSCFLLLGVAGTYAAWLGTWLPAAALLLSMQLSYGSRVLADWLWRRRWLPAQHRQLAQRLSPQQLSALLSASDPPVLQAAPACVLACRLEPGLHGLALRPGSSAGKAALLNQLQRRIEDAVLRHGGRIDRHDDTALLAVFFAGTAQEAAHRAFEAAQDVLHGVARLHRALGAAGGGIEVHAGLEAGALHDSLVGTAHAHRWRAWGAALDTAEALADQARAEQAGLLLGAGVAAALPREVLERIAVPAGSALRVDALAP